MTGFRITGKKGFHITFENGYTVSVQFGPANYCDNHDREIGDDDEACGREGSTTAEVAVWAKDGNMIEMPEFGTDTVGGWYTPEKVLALLNWAETQKG